MIYVFQGARELLIIEADNSEHAVDMLLKNGYTVGPYVAMGTTLVVGADEDARPYVVVAI